MVHPGSTRVLEAHPIKTNTQVDTQNRMVHDISAKEARRDHTREEPGLWPRLLLNRYVPESVRTASHLLKFSSRENRMVLASGWFSSSA